MRFILKLFKSDQNHFLQAGLIGLFWKAPKEIAQIKDRHNKVMVLDIDIYTKNRLKKIKTKFCLRKAEQVMKYPRGILLNIVEIINRTNKIEKVGKKIISQAYFFNNSILYPSKFLLKYIALHYLRSPYLFRSNKSVGNSRISFNFRSLLNIEKMSEDIGNKFNLINYRYKKDALILTENFVAQFDANIDEEGMREDAIAYLKFRIHDILNNLFANTDSIIELNLTKEYISLMYLCHQTNIKLDNIYSFNYKTYNYKLNNILDRIINKLINYYHLLTLLPYHSKRAIIIASKEKDILKLNYFFIALITDYLMGWSIKISYNYIVVANNKQAEQVLIFYSKLNFNPLSEELNVMNQYSQNPTLKQKITKWHNNIKRKQKAKKYQKLYPKK